MNDNNRINLDTIANDPDFNFAKKLQEENAIYGFDQNDDIETPYQDLGYLCNYYDETSFLEKFTNFKKFSVMSLNIQSLPAKFEQFSVLLNTLKKNNYSPSVICLQEVWQLTDDSLFGLEAYHEPIFKLRGKNTQGGGGRSLCR